MMEDDEIYLKETAEQLSNMPSALGILDGFLEAVESFTGFKNQFVAAGWSEEHAELMVLEILRMGSADANKKKEG